jgi:hypothetical protein
MRRYTPVILRAVGLSTNTSVPAGIVPFLMNMSMTAIASCVLPSVNDGMSTSPPARTTLAMESANASCPAAAARDVSRTVPP